MADAQNSDKTRAGEDALDSIAVAPPSEESAPPPAPEVREAEDADDHAALKRDPTDADSKLDIGIDESFPTSDPPSITQPGHNDPAPSSGFDEDAEAAMAEEKAASAAR